MANTTIEIKFSQVSGNTPSTLANGEISINTADGRFFYKSPSGTITPFARYPGPAGLNGEIQFNDSGVLGSSANLSINKTTGVLTVGGAVVTNAYVQFSDGTRQYTANAGGSSSVTSVAGATGVVSNTQLINAVTSTNQITFNSIVTSNNGQGTNFRIGDDAWLGDVNIADTARLAGLQNSANGFLRFGATGTEALGRAGAGPLLWGANTIWHSGNDGTGSGLDADTLDGLTGTSYANSVYDQAGFDKANTAQTTAAAAFNAANTAQTTATNALSNTVQVLTVNSATRIVIANTTSSSSFDTGALVVNGGIGANGNLYIKGPSSVWAVVANSNNYQLSMSLNDSLGSLAVGWGTSGSPSAFMSMTASGGKNQIFTNSRDFRINTGIGDAFYINASTNNSVVIPTNVPSVNTTSGSLIVAGGLGVSGNVHTGKITLSGTGNGITFVDGTIQTTAAFGETIEANTLVSKILANTVYTLGNSRSYTLTTGGKTYMDFYVDGYKMTRNIDYTENTTTAIVTSISIPIGSVVEFRIEK